MSNEKPPERKKQNKESPFVSMFGTASVMGMHMVSGPIVGAFFGYFFDKYVGTAPFGFVIGIVLGVIAGYINVMRDAKLLQKEQERIKNLDIEKETEQISPQEHIEYGLFGEEKRISFKPKTEENNEEQQ